jgi:hypothetical protein
VINLVSYNIVQQMSLSSSEFSKGVNEFTKSGFTPIPSDLVKPFRVKESPVQLECTIKDIVSMGDEGGAGNLVICEIVKMHISEQVLDANKQIDPHKIDLVGRMGGNWYCRASGDSIFKIEKPGGKKGIGFDGLPKRILNSFILTGNDLAKLAGVEVLPTTEDVNRYKENTDIAHILHTTTDDEEAREELHYHAKALLEENKIVEAWSTLLIDKLNRV